MHLKIAFICPKPSDHRSIFSEESSVWPAGVKAKLEVIVSEPTTEAALERLIYSLHDKLNKKTTEDHKQLTNCHIWIYLSKEQAEANQFAMFLNKNIFFHKDLVINKNEDQLSHLNDKPRTRFGLNDSERKEVYKDLGRLYWSVDAKIALKYPYSSKLTDKQSEQRDNYRDKLRDQQMSRLSKKWELRTWMLDEINHEGGGKGWFFPDNKE